MNRVNSDENIHCYSLLLLNLNGYLYSTQLLRIFILYYDFHYQNRSLLNDRREEDAIRRAVGLKTVKVSTKTHRESCALHIVQRTLNRLQLSIKI